MFLAEQDQLAGLRKGQRAQKERVDEAEHSGVRADAQAQRENGEHGEAGTLGEKPRGVANICEQALHLAGNYGAGSLKVRRFTPLLRAGRADFPRACRAEVRSRPR